MPIYSFICSDCGHEQDHLLKINESLNVCPKCNMGTYLKQLTAPSGFSFKGGGFYETDFKSKSGNSSANKTSCGGSCACHPKKS